MLSRGGFESQKTSCLGASCSVFNRRKRAGPEVSKMTPVSIQARRAPQPSFVEFVSLIAMVMGLTAFSIDNLLPAFSVVQDAFAISSANELQLLITAYMIGFGLMQLVYGPAADIVGRKPILTAGLGIYTLGCVIAIFAQTYDMLLAARIIQGLGAASGRVLAVTIVRDRFEGREMARVMSLTMMIFIMVPIVAPAFGSALLLIGSWRWIFVCMLILGLMVVAWFSLRMPETLHPEYRVAFSFATIFGSIRLTVTSRLTVGYSTAMALLIGALMTYIGSAQQIFETDVYALGAWFPLVFAGIAACMGAASLVNARLVRRLGMRRLSQMGILGFIAASLLLLGLGIVFDGRPPLLLFGACLALAHFLMSLCLPNFNTLAMEPLGAVAGTASSFMGFYTTLVGAAGGYVVGQAFDGTIIPLSAGYLVFGLLCLAVIGWTERFRFFTPQHPDPL